MAERYVLALGSNRRHVRHGRPERVIAAAIDALRRAGVHVVASSRTERSRPVGPSRRDFANSAILIETTRLPGDLLDLLQTTERAFGRVQQGQSWSARVLDLDVVLWSGGCWAGAALVIPHVSWRRRLFVTRPVREVARHWRDPLTGLSVAQTHARLTRPRALPKSPPVRPRG